MLQFSLFSRTLAACAVALAVGLTTLHAGSSANSKSGLELYGEPAIRTFAEKVNATLDAKGVNVAIIARSGRPRNQLPDGISYTHVAIVVFEPVRTPSGAVGHTYTVYNLYQGEGGRDDRSYLAQDFTYDFLCGSREKDVGVIVPLDALQKKILGVIRSPAYKALHNPHYNLVANPWQHQFDNCVTHTLRVVVAAIYGTSDESRIQQNIRTYFKPTPVRLGVLKAIGSNFITAVSHEDEDPSGLQTASFDSLKVFFEQNQIAKESFRVVMD
jgi:hypothetical protein